MKKIYLSSPHMSEEGYEIQFINDAFEKNWVAPLGENVNKFEEEVSKYVGSNYSVALASGTSSIHLGLKSLGVGKGDIVFCSSLTFSASCNPIIYLNATPVFIDSEKDTWNMNPKLLEKAFKKYKPKAVVLVHLYGHSAKIEEILEICKKHNTPILEDSAESLGTTYKGKHTGTFGECGIYSFNGNKIITTSGGGMLVSNNEEKIEKARFWATQSRENKRHYEHKEIGFNYRMSNVLAGIGRGQFKVLENRIAKKKKIYETYKKAFEEIKEIKMHPVNKDESCNYWLSTLTIDENSKVKPLDIIESLEKENIESRPVWKPMHMQPVFKQYDFIQENDQNKSIAQDIFERGICLPSDTKNTKEDMERIINIIKKSFKR